MVKKGIPSQDYDPDDKKEEKDTRRQFTETQNDKMSQQQDGLRAESHNGLDLTTSEHHLKRRGQQKGKQSLKNG
jgi:hypothetical protein